MQTTASAFPELPVQALLPVFARKYPVVSLLIQKRFVPVFLQPLIQLLGTRGIGAGVADEHPCQGCLPRLEPVPQLSV